jgi:hypothetical protein
MEPCVIEQRLAIREPGIACFLLGAIGKVVLDLSAATHELHVHRPRPAALVFANHRAEPLGSGSSDFDDWRHRDRAARAITATAIDHRRDPRRSARDPPSRRNDTCQ